jgi:hypothetical protein
MKINYATRQLIRTASKGFLSTHLDPKNFQAKKIDLNKAFPYSTFTLTAFDYDLSPIVLLSNLSEHTVNIEKNNLVSLMVCEEQKIYQFFPKFRNKIFDYEDPMSRPRITLIGNLKITKNKNHRKRFLNRHPAAKLYSNFTDMNFFKLDIKGAHLVGGFAHVKWFEKNDIYCKNLPNFEQVESEIIKHMNQCHKESLNLYATKLIKGNYSRLKDDWNLVGVDPDGFDLRRKNLLARFFFKEGIKNVRKLRETFVDLHKLASKY